MRTHKRCPSCERTLSWEAFAQDLTLSTGVKGLCKECFNAKSRAKWKERTEAQRLARNARDRATYARGKTK